MHEHNLSVLFFFFFFFSLRQLFQIVSYYNTFWCLIWVDTVCSGLSFRTPTINTAYQTRLRWCASETDLSHPYTPTPSPHKTQPSSFTTDCSKAAFLLQFFVRRLLHKFNLSSSIRHYYHTLTSLLSCFAFIFLFFYLNSL